MSKSRLVSITTLQECLEYIPETGMFFWKHRPEDHFISSRAYKTWNTRFAGAQAFTTKHDCGYLQGTVNNIRLFAHRVAWALHYDEWPSEQIGHLNGNRADNRIANLVDRERRLNTMAGHRPTPYAVAGVYQDRRTKRWIARIKLYGKTRHLGCFSTFEEAVTVRRTAEREAGGYNAESNKRKEIA